MRINNYQKIKTNAVSDIARPGLAGRSSNRGFTIVELMIVIIVIAILAAITIVAYTGVQSRARITAAQSEVRQLGQTMQIYQARHGSLPSNASEVRSALEESGALALGTRTIDGGGRFVYCATDNGQDLWVLSSAGASTDNQLAYWRATSGSIDTTPFESLGYGTWHQNACHSITGGAHDRSFWSTSV